MATALRRPRASISYWGPEDLVDGCDVRSMKSLEESSTLRNVSIKVLIEDTLILTA